MITPEYIVCANAGDSRAIMSKVYNKAIELSHDHKPDNPEEKARIEAAGGFVSVDNRVDGYLALSRALGDFELKGDPELLQEEQKVSCIPEIKAKKRESNDEMVVLACDGLWDVFSNDEVIENVRQIWNEGERNIQLVAEEMCDQALFTGSMDNISVIVVKLQGAQIAATGGGVIGRRTERLFPR
jgi:serine/threonine protein phosphatase PrpC